MDNWEAVLSAREFEDYSVIRAPVPECDPGDRRMLLGKCMENLCGSYGTNWGCPPAIDVDPERLYGETEFVILVKREFCTDSGDREVLEAIGEEMQRIVRMMVVALRGNGIDCLGFADGGCKYCGVCAMPDPCRFPDMFVPSVSSLGLDLSKYLRSVGEEFRFADGCVTLYGMIFVKKTE